MDTTYFYAPAKAFRNGYVALPPDEAHHASRALRVGVGDEIVVVDGFGGWHRVCVDHAGKREVGGVVVESRRDVGEPVYDLSIGLAVLKSRSRYETFLEKAAEMGVREVIPLVTSRTERPRLKASRAQSILIAAMKQSQRSRLVKLHEPLALDDVLADARSGLRLMCHEDADPADGLFSFLTGASSGRIARVLIGPEGGFSEEEVDGARAADYQIVSLGSRRLRAETAALAVASGTMLAWDSAPRTTGDLHG